MTVFDGVSWCVTTPLAGLGFHMVSRELIDRFYGDGSRNGTRAFYSRLRQRLKAEMRVLNVGAGPATRSPIRAIKGEVAEVVGTDVDPIVLANSELDRALVISGGRIPVGDASFDLAYADNVLEHVENPELFLREICRVLKPGSQFLFRTPNLYHYVALGSRCTPHWVHRLVAHRMRGLPAETHEPWRTFYRLNTGSALRKWARTAGFQSSMLEMFEPEPSYLVFNSIAFLVGVAYERTVNSTSLLSGLRANILGVLTK